MLSRFELTAEQARGSGTDPGWFFVLQEHPSEPKFKDPQQPTSGNRDKNFAFSDYAFENGGNPVPTAAVLAAKAFESPIRAVILGSELLPPTS